MCVCVLTIELAQVIRCNPACSSLLMNSDHKPKLGHCYLVYWVNRSCDMCWQLSVTGHGLLVSFSNYGGYTHTNSQTFGITFGQLMDLGTKCWWRWKMNFSRMKLNDFYLLWLTWLDLCLIAPSGARHRLYLSPFSSVSLADERGVCR